MSDEKMNRFRAILLLDGVLSKAKGEDLKSLMQMQWDHESGEGDNWQKRQIVRWAESHNMTHMLPEEAHGMLHEMGVQHTHSDTPNDENGQHSHAMVKQEAALPESEEPLAMKAVHDLSAFVHKAWESDGLTYSEGWISTPDKDLQGERYEPEAFTNAIEDYMLRGGPHSSEHNTDGYPVGHVQKIAVVRDGQVVKSASHPSDPAEFEHFPGSGNGLYGRVVYSDATAAFSVKAGNMRSYSWIGKPTKRDAADSKHVLEVNPILETTSSAYPVNTRAAMLAAKANSGKEPQD